jgi:uncharacterized protein (TIGR02302 family)
MTDLLPPMATDRLQARLRRQRALARAVLMFERAWPLLWPLAGLIGAFLCLALLGLPMLLPGVLHALLLAGFAFALAVLAVRAWRRLRWPGDTDADRRLERDSGLRHRPLQALADRPALPGAEALWQAHLRRAAADLRRLRVGLPRPGLAALDRRALRGGLLVALAACFVVAGSDAPARIGRALVPAFAAGPPTPATELQAWITPPGYTNGAPVFLRPDLGAVGVPAGSHLTVSVTGGHGEPGLFLGNRRLPFQTLDTASFQADQDLAEGGRLVVRRNGSELGAWDLAVVADSAPFVRWNGAPGQAAPTRIPLTRLPWEVSHAYGVVSLQAEMRLRERPQDPPLVVQIPLPGGAPRQARGARVQDLTAHPWAGLPVIARLVGRDAPGLAGHSADASFTLPARRFDNPVARALIAVRRNLTLHPEQRAPSIAALDQIADMAEVWRDDAGGYLNLRAASEQLLQDRGPAAVGQVQATLWQLALHLEEGATEKTARQLAEARQSLRDALNAQKRGEKIDPREIERRIDALERAIQQHLQALAEQLRRDPDAQIGDPQQGQMDAQDAQRQAEALRRAIEQGQMQDAQQQMAELEQMLDALEHAHPMHRDAQARARAQKQQRGQQQLNAVQDMVQREGRLLDHAQARADAAAQQGTENPADGPAPQAIAQDAARGQDARVQRALRRALGEVMQQYGDLMGKIPPNLGDADAAMREAAKAMSQSQDEESAADVRQAIEALQQGGQAMSQQMAEAFGGQDGQQDGQSDGQGNGQEGPGITFGNSGDGNQDGSGGNRPWQRGGSQFGRRGGDRRTDPFGRQLQDGADGTDQNADVTLPDQMEAARTRAIQEELRRRGADRTRPQPELDYIDRLLKQF